MIDLRTALDPQHPATFALHNMVTEGHHLIQQQQQQQRRFLNDERAMVIQQHPASAADMRQHSPASGVQHQSMDEQTAAMRAAAAAAAAAAAFGSGNLAAMNLPGMMPAELMSQLQQQQQQQQQRSQHEQQVANANQSRKQREFIPDNKKDDSYWDRRRRNNEAAKRSREKRRLNDMVLESRVLELTKENHILRAQLGAVRDKYNINPDSLISIDQVLASLPSPDQVLSLPRPRSRLLSSLGTSLGSGSLAAGLGSVSPSPSNRSLSPPPSVAHHMHHHREHGQHGQLGQHGQQQQQQQQRQSVLMSMNRQTSVRSPSPTPMQQLAFSANYHRYESLPVQQYQQQQHHQQQHQQQQSHAKNNANRGDRSLPPLPALTPVPAHSPEERSVDEAHMSSADRSGSGNVAFFDLCTSSSSSSSQHGGDDGSASPVDPSAAGGRLLPHKLRHKSHLGDREAAASAALLTLNEIKHEPEAIDDSPSPANSIEMNNNLNGSNSGRRSTESIEDRDSGISSAGEWSVFSRQTSGTSANSSSGARYLGSGQAPAAKRMRTSPVPIPFQPAGHHSRRLNEDDEAMTSDPSAASSGDARASAGYDSMDDSDVRTYIARIASELESLKSYMLGNNNNNNNNNNININGAASATGAQQAIRNNSKTNSPSSNSATYRLH